MIAGKTVEISKYYSHKYKSKSEKRAEKENKTKEAQEKINKKRREKKLTRLLNTNFQKNDYHIVLDYEKEKRPDNIDQMKNDIKQFLKKLRKEYKNINSELKYIHVPERGKRGALHHHLVINNIDPSVLTKIWNKGRVHINLLDATGQYKDLACYLLKYTDKEKLNSKAWNSSRNLKKPIVIKKIISKHDFFKDKVNIPKKYTNYYLDKNSVYSGINEAGYKYFTYTLIKQNE